MIRYVLSETIEPAYAERRSKRAIIQYSFQLSAMLKTDTVRSRKQRRTLKQIHDDLKECDVWPPYSGRQSHVQPCSIGVDIDHRHRRCSLESGDEFEKKSGGRLS